MDGGQTGEIVTAHMEGYKLHGRKEMSGAIVSRNR